MKLDLGAGQRCKEGFEGVDIAPGPGVIHLVDLFSSPWLKMVRRSFTSVPDTLPSSAYITGGVAFASESVDEIWCSHLIEHTPNLIHFMDECWRVMKPGAIATFAAPYYTSRRAWQDPTHTRAISEVTFAYFDKKWREREKLDHYPIRSDFEIELIKHAVLPQFMNLPPEKLQECINHNWNVVEDIHVTLRKR